jgi:hypothetical protein
VSARDDSDDLVVLARLGELTTAQLLCGRLAAEGIDAHLPDAQAAIRTWQLRSAGRGIAVQVRKADLERAKAILAEPGLEQAALAEAAATSAPGESKAGSGAEADVDDGTIGAGDRAAFRALRVTLASLWLLGLVHPYSLWLAMRALGRRDLTPWGRSRAWLALWISVAGCLVLGLLIHRLVRLAG